MPVRHELGTLPLVTGQTNLPDLVTESHRPGAEVAPDSGPETRWDREMFGTGDVRTGKNEHMDPVIIEVALNGATRPRSQPHVPINPEQIATSGIACVEAGPPSSTSTTICGPCGPPEAGPRPWEHSD